MSIIEQRSIAEPDKGPTGSAVISATVGVEMWERFSFYGMQAIVVYYLYHSTTTGGLGIEAGEATALMGAYGSLVYLSTLAGGWVADRFFGAERTLIFGALLLVFGHASRSFLSGVSGVTLGLLLIAVGSGFLKTSAITVLGAAFPADSPRRESGFQLFYLGINVGALLGPLLTGWLSTTYGFHVGFSAAALLMVVGLVHYLALRRRMLASFGSAARTAITQPGSANHPRSRWVVLALALIVLTVVALLSATGTFAADDLAALLLIATLSAAAFLFLQIFNSSEVTSTEKRSALAFLPLFIASCAFWSILNQTFGVFAVYSDLRLNRMIGDVEIPASWTQSFNPMFILLLSVPLAALWARLGKGGHRSPSVSDKMSLGLALAGCGMLVLFPFAGEGAHSTSVLVLALAVLIITLGELLVGPVGMSAATTMCPAAFRTRFAGLYFLSMAIGTATAGVLSRFYDPEDASVERLYFLGCAIGAWIIACVVFTLGRVLGSRGVDKH